MEEVPMESEADDGLADGSIHSAYATFITEAARIRELLTALETNASAEEMICIIIDKYQEQCQLLDPLLETITQQLFCLLRKSECSTMHRSCRVLYTLCKVRGYKTVVKFFPHEVSELEPCLNLLQKENPADLERWQTRYILLLWLSILVMVPFSLTTVDSKGSDSGVSLISQILETSKPCLGESARTREGAAYLLAILLTRPDMESGHLVYFLQWCREKLTSAPSQFLSAGIYSCLASIFKYGQRQSMLDKVPIVMDALAEQDHQTQARTTLQRKLICKLAQRLGLTYLPVRLASWRYQRGCRSLLENLSMSGAKQTITDPTGLPEAFPTASSDEGGHEDDSYVPREIDYIVDHMLRAMRDRDTVVRWSGAKGVGRLTGRLPRHLADEVVAAVVQQFELIEGDQDSAWHGACLALAELARRGLLLPSRLDVVVPYVLKALRYDVRKGSASVGAHVRDAACYVCWAFARAYAPAVMQPYASQISKALIVAAVYDREINCRRAASAAFQENVGRQGTFPHGIDILTKADYYTLGNRTAAYLDISIFIAQYTEYRYALIDFLVEVQLRHWDKNVRTLAASALRPLAKCDAAYLVGRVLAQLLECTLSSDLATRHGCTLGVAEVILGFADASYAIDPTWHEKFVDVVPQIEKARLYRGRGGEIMRGASCRMIQVLPLAGSTLNPKCITRLMESVDENLKHPTEDIQNAAVHALQSMSDHCFSSMPQQWQSKLVQKYLAGLSDANPAARRGFALALGALNKHLLDANLGQVLSGLVRCSVSIEERVEDRDAESRRNAVLGVMSVCKTVGMKQCYVPKESDAVDGLDRSMVDLVLDGLLKALEDYSTDHRGDVGSWVREASMRALHEFTIMLVSADDANGLTGTDSAVLSLDKSHRLFCGLLKQLGEKIDRVRECAGTVLKGILKCRTLFLPDDADYKLLTAILQPQSGEESEGEVDWSAPSATFPRLVKLLDSSRFLSAVLSGLVISCGGLTESVVRHSWNSLLEHIRGQAAGSRLMWRITDALMDMLTRHARSDRVVLPLFNTLNLLLTNGCFDVMQSDQAAFAPQIVQLVQAEMRGSRDLSKLQAGASVLCGMLGFQGAPGNRESCLGRLVALLCHKYPKVRKHVAEQLYMQLLTQDEALGAGGVEEAMELLSGVDWLDDAAPLAASRDALCALLGVAPPPPPASPAAAQGPRPAAGAAQAPASAGYADLVKQMHY